MRIFIGIKLNCIEYLSLAKKSIPYDVQDRFKWVKEDNLHLTFLFIGQLNPELIPELKARLSKELSHTNSFSIESDNYGVFYKKGKSNILWLGAKTNEKLTLLHKNIVNACSSILINLTIQHQQFNPHITLARFHHKLKLTTDLFNKNFTSKEFLINEVQIIESKSTPNGVEYDILERIFLDKR